MSFQLFDQGKRNSNGSFGRFERVFVVCLDQLIKVGGLRGDSGVYIHNVGVVRGGNR
jgi:hypothetical protein